MDSVEYNLVGSYTISEVDPATLGYSTTGWRCVDNNLAPDDEDYVVASSTTHTLGDVSLALGDNITCEITNTADIPILTIKKIIDERYGDTTPLSSFGPNVTGPVGTPSQAWSSDSSVDMDSVEYNLVGSYTISEVDPATLDYSTTGWRCVDNNLAPDDEDYVIASSTTHTLGDVSLALGDNITCEITNTADIPILTIKKIIDERYGDTTPLSSFGPNVTGPVGTPSQAWSSDSSVDMDSVEYNLVGSYTISEVDPATLGYSTTGWRCVDNNLAPDDEDYVVASSTTHTLGDVSLALGDNITCEITNTAIRPIITLVKDVDPNGLIFTPPVEPDDFDLTLDTTDVLSGDPNLVNVGTHTFAETEMSGWTAGAWSCVDADNQSVTVTNDSVNVGLADDITCTIKNTAVVPILNLRKIVDPGDTGDTTTADAFGPTVLDPDGLPIAAAWDMTLDSTIPIPITKIGTYAISEAIAADLGYSTTGWTCTDNSSSGVDVHSVSVDVDPGDNITCTITNTAEKPQLTLTKNIEDSTNDDTQTDDFGPTVTGPDGEIDVAWDAQDDTDTKILTLDTIGTYSISEEDPADFGYETDGWECVDDDTDLVVASTTAGDFDVDVTLAAGQNVTCTITNTAIVPKLTLVKNITDTTGDDTQTDDFGPTVTGPNGFASTTPWPASDTMASLPIPITEVGSYDISEELVAPLGYTTSGWSCVGADGTSFGSSDDETHTLILDTGDDVECTITNTAIEPILRLTKIIIDTTDDDTTTTDFGPTVTGPSDVDVTWAGGENDTQVVTIGTVGDYTITEVNAASLGYTTTGWSCTDADSTTSTNESVTITLDVGDDVECTITNTVIEPQLTLVKVITDETGDDTTADAFGPTLTAPDGDDVSIAWDALDAGDSQSVTLTEMGTYDISENNALALGYTTTGWVCSDGSTSDDESHSVDIGPGDDITCTITNIAIQPGLTLIKTIVDSTDDTTQTDDFGPTVTGATGDLTTDVNGDTIGWGEEDITSSQTIALDTGDYTITENTVDGYTTSGWTCTDASGATVASSATTAVDISLSPGDTLVCSITNTAIEPQLTVIKTIEDDTNDDTQTDDFGPTLLDPTGDEVTVAWIASDTSNGQTVSLTEVGEYDLSEVDPDTLGYTTEGWSCTDNNNNNVVVASSSDHNVSVDLQVGDDITCRITNTAVAPKLTLGQKHH